MLNQLFLTDRASLMQQQIFQYAALLPRQGKGLTIHRGNAAAGVEAIRVHISALRKKLRAVLGYDPIRNRIGEGYEIGGEVQ